MNINYLDYYKFRHLSCGKALLLYELLEKGIPIDYLFYDSFIETEDIMTQIFEKKLNRWLMNTSTLNDLDVIGIHLKEQEFTDFASALPYIHAKLEEGKKIFMWVFTDCIPHLGDILHGKHAIMLNSYDKNKGTFKITDIPVLVGHEYEEKYIQSAFDCLPSDYKYIDYLCDEKYNLSEDIVSMLVSKFYDSFLKVNESLLLYDKVIEMLLNPSTDVEEQRILYNRLENVFAIVAGSRYYLSKFLRVTRYLGKDKLTEIVKQSENIHYIIIRALMGGKVNINKTVEKIDRLKVLEMENIKLIKESILQGKHSKINQTHTSIADIQLRCKKNVGNRVELEWEDVMKEQLIYSYEIYLNHKLFGITLKNSYEIDELSLNEKYHVMVRVKTFRGYIDQKNDNIHVYTATELTNYAKGKPVYCSSEESYVFKKENVNNGDSKTRWSSDSENDTEWIYIDLLEERYIKRIILKWEDAYAKSYSIDISNDQVTWYKLIINENGIGGIEEHSNFEPVNCRFIKMNGIEKATRWGYSLWEIEVYSE